MKWYEVVSNFYDDGKVTANIVNVIESENEPKHDYKSNKRCDTYVDYYNDLEKAKETVRNARLISTIK